jgi:uncharacterized protein YkwD
MNKSQRSPHTVLFLKCLFTFASLFLICLSFLLTNVQAGKASRLDISTSTPSAPDAGDSTATSQPSPTPAPTNTPASTETPVEISTLTSTMPALSDTPTLEGSSTPVPSDTPTTAPGSTEAPPASPTISPTQTPVPSNTSLPTATAKSARPNNDNPSLNLDTLLSDCPDPTSIDPTQQIVDFINQQRCLQSLPPLQKADGLNVIASAYATTRSTADVWNTSHTSSDGTDWQDRLYTNYSNYFALGENTGATNLSAQGTVIDWMNNPETRANILSTTFVEIGAGYATMAGGTNQPFWVVDFGANYNNLFPVAINNFATSTDDPIVNLLIYAPSNYHEMCISNENTDCTNWVDFQSSYTWLLAAGQNGLRTVYVQLKDSISGKIIQGSATITLNTPFHDLNVSIAAGTPNGPYQVTQDNQVDEQYSGIAGGPVNVITDYGGPFVASARVLYSGNFNEMMGYPANQLTTTYWFPWYDTVTTGKVDNIVVSNPSATDADVSIYIAGVFKEEFFVPAKGSISKSYASLQTGPVKVISTNGVNILASQRLTYLSSFTEILGYPDNQLSQTYWFPWYDYKTSGMTDTIVLSNPSALNGSVQIYIAGTLKGTYTVNAGSAVSKTFSGVSGGPVKINCTTAGVNILPARIANYTSSTNEVMGYPNSQLTTQYWFPWYDGASESLYISNPSASSASVVIYIAGVKQGPYTIPANGNIKQTYAGLQAGPVKVISDINVITSIRYQVTSSALSETLGFPFNQLATQYWFPFYDNLTSGWQSFISIAR